MTMLPVAAYDEIADWYEHEFLAHTAAPGTDPLGIDAALGSLLGRGTGACLEIGCGTGVRAGRVRDLGWTPRRCCSTASWTTSGVRDKVGATHLPLPSLTHAFLDAGLTPERLAEGGEPTPVTLAIRARKDA